MHLHNPHPHHPPSDPFPPPTPLPSSSIPSYPSLPNPTFSPTIPCLSPPQPHPLWHGLLTIRGHLNSLTLPASAVLLPSSSHPPYITPDFSSWPRQLYCDASKLRVSDQVVATWQQQNTPKQRWFVRITPIDGTGMEGVKLQQLVAVLNQRKLVFEIPCSGTSQGGEGGILYLGGLGGGGVGGELVGAFHTAKKPPQFIDSALPMTWGDAGAANPPDQLAASIEVWRGILHVRGHRNDMRVHCIGVEDSGAGVVDVTGWPAELMCNAESLRTAGGLVEEMNGGQWYVRFMTDGEGNGWREKMEKLVRVLVERELVFEIECKGEGGGTKGVLYLWGLLLPEIGYSMVGVFRPGGRRGVGVRGVASGAEERGGVGLMGTGVGSM